MGMPIITASTTTREQAITYLIQSVALEETALSHILNADYGVGAGITGFPKLKIWIQVNQFCR